MMRKSKPNEFNIVFKENNPQHKAAMDILNSKGRKKAQFIAEAVLFFVNNNICNAISEKRIVSELEPDRIQKRTALKGLSKFKNKMD